MPTATEAARYTAKAIEDDKQFFEPLDVQHGGDHYKKYKIQPVEFCYHNKIPALEAGVIKYIIRHRDKGGLEDLKKAKHLIEILEVLAYGDSD